MPRPSSKIVQMQLIANAVAGAVTASGLGTDLGINPALGVDNKLSEAMAGLSQLTAGGFNLNTLVGIFNAILGIFLVPFKLIFYVEVMFVNLGVPVWLIGIVVAPAAYIVAADAAYVISGRDI